MYLRELWAASPAAARRKRGRRTGGFPELEAREEDSRKATVFNATEQK